MWTTVSKKIFDLISLGKAPPPDVPVLISGFSISTDGHTTATNRGGSVVTLVLRMWGVIGNKPLQEKGPESVALITLAINQTVGRVKEALEKQRPPSPPTGMYIYNTHCICFYLYIYTMKILSVVLKFIPNRPFHVNNYRSLAN